MGRKSLIDTSSVQHKPPSSSFQLISERQKDKHHINLQSKRLCPRGGEYTMISDYLQSRRTINHLTPYEGTSRTLPLIVFINSQMKGHTWDGKLSNRNINKFIQAKTVTRLLAFLQSTSSLPYEHPSCLGGFIGFMFRLNRHNIKPLVTDKQIEKLQNIRPDLELFNATTWVHSLSLFYYHRLKKTHWIKLQIPCFLERKTILYNAAVLSLSVYMDGILKKLQKSENKTENNYRHGKSGSSKKKQHLGVLINIILNLFRNRRLAAANSFWFKM